MKESFNYDVIATMCVDTSEEIIRDSIKAKVNIVLSFEALGLAKYMEENYDIPYIYGAPYGYKNTLEWLNNISKIINVSVNKNIINRIMKKTMEIKQYRMYLMMLKDVKSSISMYTEHDRIVGFKKIVDEFGFYVDSTICSHSLKDIKDDNIITLNSEKERIDIFNEKNHQLIIADDITFKMVNNTNIRFRASMPVVYGNQVANHLPLVGIKGMDYFVEFMNWYMQTLSQI